MPTTQADLDRWEYEKDTDKFIQILRYLKGEKYLNMRMRAVVVLGVQRETRYIPYLLTEMGITPDSRNVVEVLLVNWGIEAAQFINDYLRTQGLSKQLVRDSIQVIGKFNSEIAYSIYLCLLLEHRFLKPVIDNIDTIGMTSRFFDLLNDSDPHKRWAGLEVIRYSRVTRISSELVLANILDEDLQLRTACFSVLENFLYEKDESIFKDFSRYDLEQMVAEPTRKGLFDDEAEIRRLTLSIIGRIEDGACVSRIIELTFDPYRMVRKEALFALGSVYHHSTKLLILGHYLDPENDSVHRAYALRALGTCLDDGSFEILKGILFAESDIKLVARILEIMLERQSWQAELYLITLVLENKKVRDAITRYTRRNPYAADCLFVIIKQEKDKIRIKATIWLIGELGISKHIECLFAMMEISDEYLEEVAYAAYRLINTLDTEPLEYFSQIDTKGNSGREKLKALMIERLEDEEYEWEDMFGRNLDST